MIVFSIRYLQYIIETNRLYTHTDVQFVLSIPLYRNSIYLPPPSVHPVLTRGS